MTLVTIQIPRTAAQEVMNVLTKEVAMSLISGGLDDEQEKNRAVQLRSAQLQFEIALHSEESSG